MDTDESAPQPSDSEKKRYTMISVKFTSQLGDNGRFVASFWNEKWSWNSKRHISLSLSRVKGLAVPLNATDQDKERYEYHIIDHCRYWWVNVFWQCAAWENRKQTKKTATFQMEWISQLVIELALTSSYLLIWWVQKKKVSLLVSGTLSSLNINFEDNFSHLSVIFRHLPNQVNFPLSHPCKLPWKCVHLGFQ